MNDVTPRSTYPHTRYTYVAARKGHPMNETHVEAVDLVEPVDVVEPPRADPTPVCLCGHVREAHEHYRKGTDCPLCEPGQCNDYRRDPNQ